MTTVRRERPRVVVAGQAGLCSGVRRAVALVEELVARRDARVLTTGLLVHNRTEVARLAALGVEVAGGDRAVGATDHVVVRTHGLPPRALAELRATGARIHDGTCPYVRSAQALAARAAAAGFAVICVGDGSHPEVAGVLGFARERGAVALALEDESRLAAEPALASARRAAILAQTTIDPARLRAVAAAAVERFVELRVFNTICRDTLARRRGAVALAAEAELVLVVGDRGSANTRHLAALCAATAPRAELVESAIAVDPAWLRGVSCVAVTSGASTPSSAISAVVERLHELVGAEGSDPDGR
jgi:4-hydroxy-3-methylbut-2-enyl diphosphate reductase